MRAAHPLKARHGTGILSFYSLALAPVALTDHRHGRWWPAVSRQQGVPTWRPGGQGSQCATWVTIPQRRTVRTSPLVRHTTAHICTYSYVGVWTARARTAAAKQQTQAYTHRADTGAPPPSEEMVRRITNALSWSGQAHRWTFRCSRRNNTKSTSKHL